MYNLKEGVVAAAAVTLSQMQNKATDGHSVLHIKSFHDAFADCRQILVVPRGATMDNSRWREVCVVWFQVHRPKQWREQRLHLSS